MFFKDKISVLDFIRKVKFYFFCALCAFAAISKTAIEIMFAAILLLWLAENILVNKANFKAYFPKTRLNLPLAALLTVLFITIFSSYAFSTSLKGFFSGWVKFIMLYFFTVDILDSKIKFRNVLLIFSLSLTVVLLDGMWQFAAGRDFLHGRLLEGLWARAHFSGLSVFGGFIVLLSPPVITFLLGKLDKIPERYESRQMIRVKKIFGVAVFVLFLISLLITCSIEAWIAIIAAIMIVLFRDRRKMVRIILVLMLAPMAVVSFSPPFKAKISDSIYVSLYDKEGRWKVWKQYVKEIIDNPVFGKGIDTTTVQIAEKYAESSLVARANPYSRYLLIALEVGALGLLAYLWVLARIFKVLLRSRHNFLQQGLFTGFSAFVVINMFDNIWDERLLSLFWVLIGLIIVYNRLGSQEWSAYGQEERLKG